MLFGTPIMMIDVLVVWGVDIYLFCFHCARSSSGLVVVFYFVFQDIGQYFKQISHVI